MVKVRFAYGSLLICVFIHSVLLSIYLSVFLPICDILGLNCTSECFLKARFRLGLVQTSMKL